MEGTFYISELAFKIVMFLEIVGLGFTCALLIKILIKELKSKTIW